MRPLELIIDGFRSFDRRTRFDWRGRSLVGIVGPIGSGKSSILDAISFALYSKTPVFERENKTLINHGRQQARIELAFEIDGQSWRAVRVIRRKGASQHALYRTDDGAPDSSEPISDREREMNRRVEQLLGLDFQAFNRSILLAQNRFARFLEASPTDRDRVLKGVFGFDRVDAMHERAKQHRTDADLAVRTLDGRLATLADDQQHLATARESLTATTRTSEAIEACVTEVRALVRREQEAARSAHQHEARMGELDGLAVRIPAQTEIDQVTAKARQAEADLDHARQARGTARLNLEQAEADRQSAVDRFGTPDTLAEAERAIAVRERAQKAASRHATAQEDANAEDTRHDTEASAATERTQAAQHAVELAAEALARQEATRHTAQSALADFEVSSGGDVMLARAGRNLEDLVRARSDAETARLDRAAEETSLSRAESTYEDLVAAHATAAAREREAETARQTADAALADAEKDVEHAHHHDLALALAERLQPGEPCPVCTQIIKEAPRQKDSSISETTEARDAARREADHARGALRTASSAAAGARQAMTNANETRTEARQRWQTAGDRLRTSETRCSTLAAALTDQLGLGDPTQRLREASSTLEALTATHHQAEQAEAATDDTLREARHQFGIATERAAAAEARAQARRRQHEQAAAAEEAAQAEVADANQQLSRLLGEGKPSARLRAARDGIRAAEAQLEKARAAERQQQAAAEATAVAHDAARQTEQTLVRRLANLAGSIGTEASLGDEHDLRALKATVDTELRLATDQSLRDRDASYDQQQQATTAREGLLAPLGIGPEDDFDAAVSTSRTARDRDQATVESLEQRLAKAETLIAEREQADRRLATFRTLADELTAPRFLRFLLDEERAALADLGSRRFEMLSGGRYCFTDDGSFDVIDLANAETTRKSETLSGGETFLASLALALALAETVTRVGGRLDAFFLDEGFGSLDDEHLDFAMDGIERLVTDAPNRLVTVVSHVHAMRDRIDDLIVLDKDPVTGSSIVVSGASA